MIKLINEHSLHVAPKPLKVSFFDTTFFFQAARLRIPRAM